MLTHTKCNEKGKRSNRNEIMAFYSYILNYKYTKRKKKKKAILLIKKEAGFFLSFFLFNYYPQSPKLKRD